MLLLLKENLIVWNIYTRMLTFLSNWVLLNEENVRTPPSYNSIMIFTDDWLIYLKFNVYIFFSLVNVIIIEKLDLWLFIILRKYPKLRKCGKILMIKASNFYKENSIFYVLCPFPWSFFLVFNIEVARKGISYK